MDHRPIRGIITPTVTPLKAIGDIKQPMTCLKLAAFRHKRQMAQPRWYNHCTN